MSGYTTVNTLGSGFYNPIGVAVDGSGNVFVGDTYNNAVKEITTAGGNFGSLNVGSSSASPISLAFTFFTFDTGGTLGSTAVLTQGAAGLDFTDAGTGTCTPGTVYYTGDTCTVDVTFKPGFPGTRYGAAELLNSSGNLLATGYVQGTGAGPQMNFLPGVQSTVGSGFTSPIGVAVDGSGNIFVADYAHSAVKEMLAAGGYTTVNTLGSGFNIPIGVAVDGSGNVFIADSDNDAVKEILAAGGYTTVNTLGSGFNEPAGVAVDGSGNVFVADSNNNAVKEILAVGGYTTVNTLGSGFHQPQGVAVDASGNVFVADFSSSTVKEIVAVNGSIPASPTINTLASGFILPIGVAVDGSGNVFIADEYNSTVKEILAAGGYTTVNTLGSGFNEPAGVAVDGSGNVFVADSYNHRVERLDYADPPSLSFTTTPIGSVSSDSPQTVTVENIGNATLSTAASGITLPADFKQVTGSGLPVDCKKFFSLFAGASCRLRIEFAPVSVGNPINEALVITDNSLNASAPSPATQSIQLSGISLAPATLTSPAPGSTLAGGPITFGWTPGNAATGYALWIGSTGPGSDNLYYSGEKASTVNSLAVSGLPVNGETIYVRLITYYGSSNTFNSYTYTSAKGGILTAPAPGSTLTSDNVTFGWTAGVGATGYALWIGSTGVGSDNLYYSGEKASTVTSLTVNGLPVNGETIYVRLITYYGTSSALINYTYTTATAAVLTTPSPGSKLAGPSVTFSWTAAASATGYALWAGTTGTGTGADNLYYSGEKASTVTSLAVSGLPANGKPIYMRLITYYGTASTFTPYTYTAATAAVLTSPAPSGTLSGPTVTFNWTAAANATGYALWAGTTGTGSGANNLYSSGEKASTITSLAVSGLPVDGEAVYVRLITYYGTASTYNTYAYTAAIAAVLTTPTPGGTLAGSSVTFNWSSAGSATGYALWIGSTGTGSDNLYYSGEKAPTVTSLTVNGLPTNGETIYVRLITYHGSSNALTNYTYTAK